MLPSLLAKETMASCPSSSLSNGWWMKKKKKKKKTTADDADCCWLLVGMDWPSSSSRAVELFLFKLMIISLLCTSFVTAEKNKHYHVASLCKSHFLQQLYRKIDGAVLRSQNEPNLDCLITFQTETVLQRFMLRFDQLQLDCNDHLLVYDGAHATGNYKADLSCRHTRQSVGTIYTRTNFVTLKYVTDGWGTDTNGFHLVVTAFKDKTELVCRDFRCAQKDFCISTDLLCDGVNHCGDNTDETTTSLCADNEQHLRILGLNLPVFGAVAGSLGVVLLCAVTASVVICCCRRKRSPALANNTGAGQSNSTGNNGRFEDNKETGMNNPGSGGSQVVGATLSANKQLPATSGYMTLPLKSVLSSSGNRRPPAIDQGHFLIQRVITITEQHRQRRCHRHPITRNSLVLCKDIIIITTKLVDRLQCYLNNISSNLWALTT